MTAGAFILWPLDRAGNLINYSSPDIAETPHHHAEKVGESKVARLAEVAPAIPASHTAADPTNPEAVDIYFGVVTGANRPPPPQDQVELLDKIQKVLRTIQVLYLKTAPAGETDIRQFRSYYVRLFRLGQVGLEGENVATDIASAAFANTLADLIDDEAGNVKAKHLRKLGMKAMVPGLICGVLYVLLRLTSTYWPRIDHFLLNMGVDSNLLSNFVLLLIGSFVGVWLSYAIRTTTFTLSDLTVTDADRLTPEIRLVFAGALTVILGILFCIPLLELRVGEVAMTNVAAYPMLAFVVGVFCGVSELTLPTAIASRANDFIQNIK
jgi:hypothetical protein